MLKRILNKRLDFIVVFFLILSFLIIYFTFRVDVIGYWESLSIYSMLEPNSYPPMPNIQIRGDSTGGQGLGYPLLVISKYFSNFFTLSLSSLKYLYLAYTSIFLILFYNFIKKISGRYVSIFSIVVLIFNPYFINMSTFLSAQQISLTLIFLLLFFISEIKYKTSLGYFILTSISISLILMNYIYGRYILVVILLYYFFDYSYKKKINSKDFYNSCIKFLKLIILSLFLLIIFYPPNISLIFSKKLFLPVVDGEVGIFDYNIFELFYLNFTYLLKAFFINAGGELYFNIINGEKIRVFDYFLLVILLQGLLIGFADKKMMVINIITLTLIILICLSYSDFENSKVINTSISVYRFYMCIPFLSIYIGYGLNLILNFFNFSPNKKKIICLVLISLFSVYSLEKINVSNNKFKNIKNNISKNTYKKESNLELNYKTNLSELENDYHLKILNLCLNINRFLQDEVKSKKIEYIFLEQDIDFNFNKTPPRLSNLDEKKYQFHIFNTLYLNDLSKKRFSYLINSNDQNALLKKIYSYGKIEQINGSLLDHKVLEKKIGKFLYKFMKQKNNDAKEKFVQAKISYFYEPDYIIIYNNEEYEFVVNDLKKEVKKILLSNIF